MTDPKITEQVIEQALELQERGVSAHDIAARFPEHAALVSEVLGIVSALTTEREALAPPRDALVRILNELPDRPRAFFARSFGGKKLIASFTVSVGVLAVAVFAVTGLFSGARPGSSVTAPEAAPTAIMALDSAGSALSTGDAPSNAKLAAPVAVSVTGSPDEIVTAAVAAAASDQAAFQAEGTKFMTLTGADYSAAQDIGQFYNATLF